MLNLSLRTSAWPGNVETLPSAPGTPSLRSGFDVALLQKHLQVVKRRVHATELLFRAGEPFGGLYLVHAGCFKSVLTAADGRERVTAFRLRGELLGSEAFGTDCYQCDAVALDNGEVWQLPRQAFSTALARVPALAEALTAALAAELRQDRACLLSLGTHNAEQRVATLLLDLGQRFAALGFSGTHYLLRMTRAEIGSFLGLQLETVTRAMSNLAGLGLIAVQRKDIHILQHAALLRMTGAPAMNTPCKVSSLAMPALELPAAA